MIGQSAARHVFSTAAKQWIRDCIIIKQSDKCNSGYWVMTRDDNHHKTYGIGCAPDEFSLQDVVKFLKEECQDLYEIVDNSEANAVIARMIHWALSQIGQSVEYSLCTGDIVANHQHIVMSNLKINSRTNTSSYNDNMLVCLCENNKRIKQLNSKELIACLQNNPEMPIYQTLQFEYFELRLKTALSDRNGIIPDYEMDAECMLTTARERVLGKLTSVRSKRLLFDKTGLSRRGFR